MQIDSYLFIYMTTRMNNSPKLHSLRLKIYKDSSYNIGVGKSNGEAMVEGRGLEMRIIMIESLAAMEEELSSKERRTRKEKVKYEVMK